ncbi:MAG TPA: Rieske 2Fe-2S domain-containing protein [Gaiellaceae bacterium]|nr:Rieske 2Fe-2S domain-containing protein [Gaiellaceae bacterium]
MAATDAVTEIHAGSISDFDVATCRLVSAGGREIGIRTRDGEFFAYENVCLHQGGPVCEGVTVGRVEEIVGPGGESVEQRFSEESINLVCPWHGFEYDLRTGALVTDPTRRLRRYEVVVRDSEVYVRV